MTLRLSRKAVVALACCASLTGCAPFRPGASSKAMPSRLSAARQADKEEVDQLFGSKSATTGDEPYRSQSSPADHEAYGESPRTVAGLFRKLTGLGSRRNVDENLRAEPILEQQPPAPIVAKQEPQAKPKPAATSSFQLPPEVQIARPEEIDPDIRPASEEIRWVRREDRLAQLRSASEEQAVEEAVEEKQIPQKTADTLDVEPSASPELAAIDEEPAADVAETDPAASPENDARPIETSLAAAPPAPADLPEGPQPPAQQFITNPFISDSMANAPAAVENEVPSGVFVDQPANTSHPSVALTTVSAEPAGQASPRWGAPAGTPRIDFSSRPAGATTIRTSNIQFVLKDPVTIPARSRGGESSPVDPAAAAPEIKPVEVAAQPQPVEPTERAADMAAPPVSAEQPSPSDLATLGSSLTAGQPIAAHEIQRLPPADDPPLTIRQPPPVRITAIPRTPAVPRPALTAPTEVVHAPAVVTAAPASVAPYRPETPSSGLGEWINTDARSSLPPILTPQEYRLRNRR